MTYKIYKNWEIKSREGTKYGWKAAKKNEYIYGTGIKCPEVPEFVLTKCRKLISENIKLNNLLIVKK